MSAAADDSFLGHPWASWIEILAVEPSSTMLAAFACTSRGAQQFVLQSRLLQLQLRANRPETVSPIRVTIDRSDGRCSAQRAALRIALNGWRAFSFAIAGADDWSESEYATVCQVLLRCMYTNARIALARVPDEGLLAQLAQFTPFLVILPSRASLQMLARPDVDALLKRGRVSGLQRCAKCVRTYGSQCCWHIKPMCLACRAYSFDKKRAKASVRCPINVRAHCAADRCIAIGKCFDCQLDSLMRTFHLCPCADCRALPTDAFVHSECAAHWLTQSSTTPTTSCIACNAQMCIASAGSLSLCGSCLAPDTGATLNCQFCEQSNAASLSECRRCLRHACGSCRARWPAASAGSGTMCGECDNNDANRQLPTPQADDMPVSEECESADSPLRF
jgi:hypothetical protein